MSFELFVSPKIKGLSGLWGLLGIEERALKCLNEKASEDSELIVVWDGASEEGWRRYVEGKRDGRRVRLFVGNFKGRERIVEIGNKSGWLEELVKEEEPPILCFLYDYCFLSNMYPCKVEIEGTVYPSVEHYYQASKCLYPMDAREIAQAKTPAMAKKLGSKLRKYDIKPGWWQYLKEEAMWKGLLAKFTQNKELKEKLLATGRRRIFDGNIQGEIYWGISLKSGYGLNKLGEMLEKVREELRQ